jgi:hypothetical protein
MLFLVKHETSDIPTQREDHGKGVIGKSRGMCPDGARENHIAGFQLRYGQELIDSAAGRLNPFERLGGQVGATLKPSEIDIRIDDSVGKIAMAGAVGQLELRVL